MKKRHKVFLSILLAIVLIIGGLVSYIAYDNTRIVNTYYEYSSKKVPENFNNYRIVFISDFHNGHNYEKLAKEVRNASPDIICIGGDLVDMITENFTNAKKLVRELTRITTVYYIYGNHEIWSKTEFNTDKPPVEEALDGLGLVMLNNKVKTIEKGGQKINLIGYCDNVHDDFDTYFEPEAKKTLTALGNTLDKSVLSILLFHRAQYFDMVSKLPYDIVLAGHLHGGQVNIPYAREWILDSHAGSSKYIKGKYELSGHTMYVCGGTALKDNLYRVFNTPEFITVELKHE